MGSNSHVSVKRSEEGRKGKQLLMQLLILQLLMFVMLLLLQLFVAAWFTHDCSSISIREWKRSTRDGERFGGCYRSVGASQRPIQLEIEGEEVGCCCCRCCKLQRQQQLQLHPLLRPYASRSPTSALAAIVQQLRLQCSSCCCYSSVCAAATDVCVAAVASWSYGPVRQGQADERARLLSNGLRQCFSSKPSGFQRNA